MHRCLSVILVLTLLAAAAADEQDRLKVGVQPDGRIVVPTNQVLKPAGRQVAFPGRPVDLAYVDANTVVVKNMRSLVFLDVSAGKIKQTLASPVGFSVIGLVVDGERIYVSDVRDHVRVATRKPDGTYEWARLEFPTPNDFQGAFSGPLAASRTSGALALAKPKDKKAAHPAGLARHADDLLWATSTRGNNVQLLNTKTGTVEQNIAVGVAPFAIIQARHDKCYVSNWGGDPPRHGEPQSTTSGTPVKIDPRTGIANDGSVSILCDVEGRWLQEGTIKVGLHPSGMALGKTGRRLYVANANSDTVSVINAVKDEVVETISCRPEGRLPFGSGSNALALSPDGRTLYVANGTNNCVAVIGLGSKATESPGLAAAEKSAVLGLIPTGWYPGAILVSPDGKQLIVANIKGHGSLSRQRPSDTSPRPADKGRNTHDHLGTVSFIDVPDADQLATYTAEVNANNRLAYSLAGLEKPRPNAKPVPVPERHGEPSVMKHVIYVIKENRTYDQVFGDMKEGNGEPGLVLFGEDVTPNHHALARQFTLFDNFYCSGVLSADGHSWVNDAYVTDYLERSFGGFTRSYPYEGTDALAFPTTGALWDNALAHKRTFYNFGEFVETTYARGSTWTDFYTDYQNGTQKAKYSVTPAFKSIEPYTHPDFPGFPLTMPDVYRAKLFMDKLKEWEQAGSMPNLTYLFLPCDHTNGTRPGSPTPKAMVADNDLALGQVVEAVSKSKFWPETCIFIVEDDPQNGFDHVDAHRTVALVISPYTKRKFVDSANYNQTSMVKTIELILGLPPMNQLDLSANGMRTCFQEKPDLTPYTCVPNQIPLDQMNPKLAELTGPALHWAKKSQELDLEKEDRADEDTFNRILWHAVHGAAEYPAKYAGRNDDDE